LVVEIKGYASLFDVEDYVGDTVRPGAFAKSLRKRGPGRLADVRMLFSHKSGTIIGFWDVIKEDRRGLWVEGRVYGSSPVTQSVIEYARSGAVDGLSIGFRTLRETRHSPRKRDILEVALFEISVVTFPAQPLARFKIAEFA
jgi:uncharacterized protein